jgi:hypothetical protein
MGKADAHTGNLSQARTTRMRAWPPPCSSNAIVLPRFAWLSPASSLSNQSLQLSADGPVTCLTVMGSDAWIGATITQSNDPTVVGLGGWWHVTDNGQGSGSAPDVTSFLGVGSLDAAAAFCANHPAYRFPFAIDGGDIQVRG